MLSQSKYIKDILIKDKMKGCITPMVSIVSLSASDDVVFDDLTLYRSIVEALYYITLIRLDFYFIVNKYCQFMVAPNFTHWLAIKQYCVICNYNA